MYRNGQYIFEKIEKIEQKNAKELKFRFFRLCALLVRYATPINEPVSLLVKSLSKNIARAPGGGDKRKKSEVSII